MSYLYAIGLGSNRRHRRYGSPRATVAAALVQLGATARSTIYESLPLGPSHRRFANAAALLRSDRAPPTLLRELKAMERMFGRRAGRRWGERVLDLDILLWSGGRMATRTLMIPHPHLLRRRFVLDPLAELTPNWRIPRQGTVRQQAARLTRPRPVHRSGRRSGP